MIRAFLPLALYFMVTSSPSFAQDNAAAAKDHCETPQTSSNELLKQASRSSEKEAKRLVDDGWQTFPGTQTIKKQLNRCYLMQFSLNDDGSPSFIIAEGSGSGQNYDAAKSQALEVAKRNLHSKMPSSMTTCTNDSTLQNTSRIITIVELYRTIPRQGKEVMLRIATKAR